MFGVSGSGGLVCRDCDGEAEGLQAAEVGADLLVPGDVAGVPVRAEVAVAGGGVVEQVPDDDHDGAGDGDLGDGLAAAAGDAGVPLAEEGGGAGGADGGLPGGGAGVAVAFLLLALAVAGSGLTGGPAQPHPGDQVGGGGEGGHVQADLGDDHDGQHQADDGDIGQPVRRGQHLRVRAGAAAGS